jgi:acyl carrier protein
VTATSDPHMNWEDFAHAVAEVAGADSSQVGHRTRLVGDLGLDSLALTEVLVMLMVDLQMTSVADQLAERDWGRVTVGDLYEKYRTGDGRASAVRMRSVSSPD